MGLWENLGGGPLFSCLVAFLCYNFSKSFEGVHEVPPSSPLSLPPCVHLCSKMSTEVPARGSSTISFLFGLIIKVYVVWTMRPSSFLQKTDQKYIAHNNEKKLWNVEKFCVRTLLFWFISKFVHSYFFRQKP